MYEGEYRTVVEEEDYDSEIAKQFIRDAEECGLEPYHYHGRFYWEGPAVNLKGAGDFYTSVPTQQDSMGLGMVVYPVQKAQLNKEEN